jgi:hypothetical protein
MRQGSATMPIRIRPIRRPTSPVRNILRPLKVSVKQWTPSGSTSHLSLICCSFFHHTE